MGPRTVFAQVVVLLVVGRQVEARVLFEECSSVNDADLTGVGSHREPCDPCWRDFKSD